MKQRTLWGDADARAGADAEQAHVPRVVADLIAEWRNAYLREWNRRRDAGELGPHIYENIRRNEELKAKRTK